MIMRGRGFTFFHLIALALIGVYYLVLFLLPADPTNPSAEFYVSDYAEAFSSATKDHFLSKSDEVFRRSEGQGPGGLQIVTATYRYPSTGSETYNKTDLFRKWKIGENDMGLLLLYSYEATTTGGVRLFKSEAEIGYRLSGYLTAGEMGRIFDETLGTVKDYTDHVSLEIAQAKAYGLILENVIPEAYNITVTPFDEARYEDYLIHYEGDSYPPSHPLSTWDFVFSYRGDFFYGFGIPLIALGVVLLGDGAIFASGKGGSSGGGGVFRIFR